VTCGNCRFWMQDPTQQEGLGLCRRFPPVMWFQQGMDPAMTWSRFPPANRLQWCGEHAK